MEKKRYVATEIAGPFVAGIRHRGRPLLLTDSEAEHEVRAGTLRQEDEKPDPKASTPRFRKLTESK